MAREKLMGNRTAEAPRILREVARENQRQEWVSIPTITTRRQILDTYTKALVLEGGERLPVVLFGTPQGPGRGMYDAARRRSGETGEHDIRRLTSDDTTDNTPYLLGVRAPNEQVYSMYIERVRALQRQRFQGRRSQQPGLRG